MRAARITLEALAAAAIGAAVVAVLYADWWKACCGAWTIAISMPLLPGELVAVLIGGGPHLAKEHHVYIGVAVEFVVVWMLWRLLVWPRVARWREAWANLS